ncbi:molybdenum cofactor guanylyltransferase [Natrarchaeobius halalkaliphilus]|uniref:Probable molybdenum cofactor guanylyltransferase n=1 Tax=Natrarchaeobius halalkaliphilus TaxID=1679091 RepID=A0A3N6LHS2_9EURY|nr:molybdenum cofactor guanylyltransferase [Natrarchaeobius halalkaliphilus]RQG86165.1 molybdenum cofactor guanylyltransferase [Natrarchaeobius halalkaliphilus]
MDHHTSTERAGIVLAGGQSTRFDDTDKAVAELAGIPMIRRVLERLDPMVDELVVNCRGEQVASIRETLRDGPGVTFAVDPVPDRGPMAGILVGLRETTATYAVVVACDMPLVDPAFVDYLFERARGCDGAVPQLEDQWFQTTQAVYRCEPMAAGCERALEDGDGRIVTALADLEYVVVEETEVREQASLETFENVNTRAELEGVADRLDGNSSSE